MAKFESISQLYNILKQARYPVTKQQLCEKLECSVASIERYLTELRDTYSLNINYQPEYKGYVLTQDPETDIELPSHLFTTQEINALLLIEQIVNDLEPGFLADDTQAVKNHLAKIRRKMSGDHTIQSDRIRMINIGKRQGNIKHLSLLTQAVLQSRQLSIEYSARSFVQEDDLSAAQEATSQKLSRKLSPQRLTHYRDNWYLDAWCHQRNALRTFALDRITVLTLHKTAGKVLSSSELDRHYKPTFGIFGGAVRHRAVLRFTPHRSQWVSAERWHQDQTGSWDEAGHYVLEIPYGDDTELIGDILKYGDQVEVLSPDELRDKIKDKIDALHALYQMS